MAEVERRTITIDRDDRRAVLRGYLTQSRTAFVLLGVLVALSIAAAALTIGESPSTGWTIAAAGGIGAVVMAAVLIWSQTLLTRKQLPLGSEFSLSVAEGTFDLDGPWGSDRIRWRQLSNLRRVGGGVYFTVAASNARLGVPGRLISDEDLARAVELIGQPDVVGEQADVSLTAVTPDALTSSIVFTSADQRVVRAALLRASWKPLAVLGALALVGLIGLAVTAPDVLRRDLTGLFGVVAAVAVISVIVLVVTVSRAVKRSLAIGTVQTLTLAPDALELTGPGGATRLLWNQLSDLKRTGDVVIVKSTPTKTRLLFVGRSIDGEQYSAIEQRIRTAQTSAGAPPRR